MLIVLAFMRLIVLGTMLAFAIVACGGKASAPRASVSSRSPTPAPATPRTASATLPAASSPLVSVVALKLVAAPTAVKIFGFKTIELCADGRIVIDGKDRGRIAHGQLEDASGKAVISVAADASITGCGPVRVGMFTASDAMNDGQKTLSVGDDGTVTITDATGASTLPAKFEAMPPNGKRAGMLLLLSFLVGITSDSCPSLFE
jgi:hypothetical protein